MSLRVIAGKARGMKLKPVPGASTRPIMDRVKEALFSIIGSEIQGANFLDLFAGTGSVGIEALSRGAESALFVDSDRRAVKIIHENLAHTRLAGKARVLRRDAFQVLAKAPDRPYRFIYVAPPQYRRIWRKALEALDANSLWQDVNCTIIAQIDPQEYDAAPDLERLKLVDEREYGRTKLLFYRYVTGAAQNA